MFRYDGSRFFLGKKGVCDVASVVVPKRDSHVIFLSHA